MSDVPMGPDFFRGRPEAYLEWCKEHYGFNPHLCPRHWMPCPVEGKPGILVSILLVTESFAFIPDNVVRPGMDGEALTTALNSWHANQTTPTCCKLGDEKMDWLWWLMELVDSDQLCKEANPEAKDRVCWRLAKHEAEHEWQRPYPRSVFDLMEEVHS